MISSMRFCWANNIFKFILTDYLSAITHILIVYVPLLLFVAKVNPIKYLKVAFEVIGLVTGIYRIIDQIHTATNATGDLVVAACVASTEGTLDRTAPAYTGDVKKNNAVKPQPFWCFVLRSRKFHYIMSVSKKCVIVIGHHRF